MSAGFFAGGDEHKASVLYFGNFPLHHSEFGWIQFVISKIDGQQFGFDLAELRRRIVVKGRFEPVEEIISVHFAKVGHIAVIKLIGLGASWSLLLQANRA